jgi:hypothetical protein
MNKETVIVYSAAAVVAAAVAYLEGIQTGIVAGLSTIGATLILWHLFDTVRDVVESHYEAKFKPKAIEKKDSSL